MRDPAGPPADPDLLLLEFRQRCCRGPSVAEFVAAGFRFRAVLALDGERFAARLHALLC